MLASPAFTVAAYLNRALDLGGGDFAGSESGASRPVPALPSGAGAGGSLLQSRMAELALLLQRQTQTCHDEIGRIGAELRAVRSGLDALEKRVRSEKVHQEHFTRVLEQLDALDLDGLGDDERAAVRRERKALVLRCERLSAKV